MEIFVYDWTSIGHTIIGHCLDASGAYKTIQITGYRPYCFYQGEYMPLDGELYESAIYQKMNTSTNVLAKQPFYKVTFNNIPNMLQFVRQYGRCYMHDIQQTTMFLASYDLDTVGWIVHDDSAPFNIKAIQDIRTGVPTPYVMAFDIEVKSSDMNMPKAYRRADTVEMISVILKRQMNDAKKILLHKGPRLDIEGVEEIQFDDEISLILGFFETIKRHDPDIITGYNIYGFDFDYLVSRLSLRLIDIPNVSRCGSTTIVSVDWESNAYGQNRYKRLVIDGRLIIDMFLYFKRQKFDSYKLDFIATKLLGEGKLPMPFKEMMSILGTDNIRGLRNVAEYCLKDSMLVLQLFERVDMWIDVCEMAKITQCRIEDIYTRGEQMKVLAQCVRECLKRRMVLQPSNYNNNAIQYEGAYVMEPTKGIYKNVVLLDFQSLYPSLIIAYNICVSTYITFNMVNEPFYKGESCTKIGTHRFLKNEVGMFPGMIKKLLSERKAVKSSMKEMDKSSASYKVLNRRQNALKLCANSVYGVMGSRTSKYFRHVGCAESVTAMGRHWLLRTVAAIHELHPNLHVIYGDTDSCMIHGNKNAQRVQGNDEPLAKEEIIQLGIEICKEMGGMLPNPMALIYEAFYESVILLNKKRYVMLDDKNNILYKGVMSARRDYCAFFKKFYLDVVGIVARGIDDISTISNVIEYIDTQITSVQSNENLQALVITKSVKDVNTYKVIQPHVYMAKRLIEKGYIIPPGTRLEYVFVNEWKLQRDKMRTLEEVETDKLTIDYAFYIRKQLLTQMNEILDLLGIKGYIEAKYLR
jgi:DNA polymerase elongation subunit (family B)